MTVSLPDYLASAAPRAALSLAPRNTKALAALAETELQSALQAAAEPLDPNKAQTQKPQLSISDQDKIRQLAIAALAQSPLDAAPFFILGQLAPEGEAVGLMEASMRRSLHETGALFWLMRQRFLAGRYADAAHMADLLLLVDPPSIPSVVPYLVQMAEKDDAIGAVNQLLARDPRWRDYVFNDLIYSIRDSRTPLRLFLPLKDSPHPPSDLALQIYIGFLLQHKLYAFAYEVWLEFLPADELAATGRLFNGNFAFPLSGYPFDWTISKGAGVAIDVVPSREDPVKRILSINYGPGRSTEHAVSEYTRLGPGHYRMSGRYKGELFGARGLQWQIKCIGAGESLGESESAIGVRKDWTPFHFEFDVPNQNCVLQQVRLSLAARSLSDWLMSGHLSYSDLAIVPLNDARQAPTAVH